MPNLSNQEIATNLLDLLIKKIARRVSMQFAVETVFNAVNELSLKYEFIQHIHVKNFAYVEWAENVTIDYKINEVDYADFCRGMNELIKITVQKLKRHADYFFIREFHEAVDEIESLQIKEDDFKLGLMQLQYIINRKQAQMLRKDEIVFDVIKALLLTLNKIYDHQRSIKNLVDILHVAQKKYPFFNHVTIRENTEVQGSYIIDVRQEINITMSFVLAEGIHRLVEMVTNASKWDDEETFFKTFQDHLGEEHLSELRKMGVTFSDIKILSLQFENKDILTKLVESLIHLIGLRTSKSFAISVMTQILTRGKNNNDSIYNNISVVRTDDGQNQIGYRIDILSDINYVDGKTFGKAIHHIIMEVGSNLGDKTPSFVTDLKELLGKDYYHAMETMGVNFHLLELRYE
jgi:hypothetical protein